jgi:hypothetical protein
MLGFAANGTKHERILFGKRIEDGNVLTFILMKMVATT